MILRLAFGSLRARTLTVSLTIVAMALSVMLFLGVEKVRQGARSSFADTISDTDLIVGARSGSIQLLLYSVFRIGNATNNVTWQSYLDIANRPEVEWIVPISLGDSHRQFRVMGTTPAFFDRYRYRGGRPLSFRTGGAPSDLYDTVIGADVAATLGYELDDPIIVAHGIQSFSEHADQPFRITGILARTGTPVDRTVIVTLEAIEAIHVDWQSGARKRGPGTPVEVIRGMDLTPGAITAAMIGVRSRLGILGLQRWINDYPEEPLLAILPGIALQELWQIVGVAETALIGVSAMVVATAIIGMIAMILSSLNERRREMAILRAMGASPSTILGLMVIEAVLSAVLAVVLGIALLYVTLFLVRPWIDSTYGLWLSIDPPSAHEAWTLLGVIVATGIASLLPALRAYRMSLADGMMVRT
ncbi:MAG: ABC transporter permease [Geminicoccaceae bacterium]